MRRACAITLTNEDRATLERWSRSRSTEALTPPNNRSLIQTSSGATPSTMVTE